MIRRELIKEKREEDFEENMVKSVVMLAKEMGWTIDHIMDMGIQQYLEVAESLGKFYEEQKRVIEASKIRK